MTATLNLNTIRQRASKFAKSFEVVTSEKERDQDFMRGFCAIFGINPSRIDWQYKVKELNKESKRTTTTFIDGVLRGTLLIEMKSAGKDLEKTWMTPTSKPAAMLA